MANRDDDGDEKREEAADRKVKQQRKESTARIQSETRLITRMDPLPSLPDEVIFHIALFLSVSDVSMYQRVSRNWKETMRFVKRKRTSVSLTTFPNNTFHGIDRVVDWLLKIRREDVIGWSAFYRLYDVDHNHRFTENEINIRKFFNGHPNIQNLEIHWLTNFMWGEIKRRYPHLSGLAFTEVDNDVRGSIFQSALTTLKIIGYGIGVESEFVRESLTHLHKLVTLAFASPPRGAEKETSAIAFSSIIGVSNTVRNIYCGTRKVSLNKQNEIQALISNFTNAKNTTLFEMLNPGAAHLSVFIRDVLPCFVNLQTLALSLTRHHETTICPDTGLIISLASHMPNLTSLTLIVAQSFINFPLLFGHREKLQVLKISGIIAENEHLADFDVDEMVEWNKCTPNLKYLCVYPWRQGCELDRDRTMQFIEVYKRWRKLEVLHMMHTTNDDLVIEELTRQPSNLKLVEFVEKANAEAAEKVAKKCSDRKLKLKVQYQMADPYCCCPYYQTNCPLNS